ncbi:MAG: hypothetical protein K8R60_17440 [Burkholderiales bacterium]|nr:hypothetical protein [Burkholderiales bacterium]
MISTLRERAACAVLGLLAACGGGGSGDPASHSVAVTVTGLRHSYNGMTLRNNGGDDLKVFADGAASFKTALASGSTYAVTVSAQPTGPDQACTVGNGSGTIAGSDVTDVTIDCPYPAAYAVGGTVSGLLGTGLGLQYNADNVSLPSIDQVNADGAFVFDASRTSAVDGTVYGVSIVNQPTNPAQTCVVLNGSGTVAGADVAGVDVVCGTHTVAVTIAGLRQHSAHGIKLQNNGGDDLVRFIDGSYAFATPLAAGSAYNVTIAAQPQTPDQTCTVGNGSGTMGSSNITNVVVDCPYPPARSVGGTITGMTGTGLDLTYFAPNLGVQLGTAAITGNSFVFAASDTSAIAGTSYSISVRVQPTNQTCFFTGPGAIAGTSFVSGTVGNADVTTLNLTCGPVGSVLPCTPPAGAGTTHGSINAAETWTEAGSPHIIPFDINVSAPVTIQECAVVRIVKGGTVTVTSGGSLVANGASGRPVTFEAKVAGQAWSSIRNLGGTLSLNHAVLTGGGDPLSTNPAFAGALHMQTGAGVGTFHVDDVEIAGSLSQGVYINGPVGFDASSQNLRVHGSAGYPVHVYARVLGSVPSGQYTGNGHDAIAIAGSGGPVVDAQTMHNRGVPYHVGSGPDGGRMDINSQVTGQVAVLTIEPGVTVQFPPGGTFNVDPGSGTSAAKGALIAIGGAAADQKIVFTSDRGAASTAGDWLGIAFNGVIDPRSTMQNVRVEFAGGASVSGGNSCPYPGIPINNAAIRIFGPPSSQFITSTEILSSALFGIDRGWRADLQPDFLASNTFTAVASCKETTPRTFNGVCPAVVPCP